MRKFCTFHAQEGHATSECDLNSPLGRNFSPKVEELKEVVSSITGSVTKQERWRAKHAETYKASRAKYMKTYRARHADR